MKFYDQKIVQEVRKERKKGLSIREIEKKLKVPNFTISRWVRDIPSDAKAFNLARQKEEFLKSDLRSLCDDLKIDKDLAKIFVSLLYWCEGSKYPSSNFVAFSNSDYSLVKVFLELLRRGFEINEDKIRIHLQLHSTHSPKEITKFWSDLLHVPSAQFYKPTITHPTNKMKRVDYRGTCTIKYFDVKLLLKIIGLYESLTKKL
ncbi:MAG: hypothetical protein WC499_04600 [Patescibacteria group bacterium]